MRMGWLLVGAVCMTALAGCCRGKTKPGDGCAAGKAACLDKYTELVCQDGKYVASPCKGVKGCYETGENLYCDVSGNSEGDGCPPVNDSNAACTTDRKAMIMCHAGSYRLHNCRGPRGCEDVGGDKVECDKTVQLEGDSCATEGSYTCSVDKQRTLVCRAGKFVLDEYCRGPKGCDSQADTVRCDRGQQNVGDPCRKQDDYECSTDGKTMLSCKAERWAVDKKCRHKCISTEDKVGCVD